MVRDTSPCYARSPALRLAIGEETIAHEEDRGLHVVKPNAGPELQRVMHTRLQKKPEAQGKHLGEGYATGQIDS